MKPIRWLLHAVGLGFLLSLISTAAINLKGVNRHNSRGRIGFAGSVVRSAVSKFRKRKQVYHTRPTHVGSAQALRLLRRMMMEIHRRGWLAFYLPKATEYDSEHIAENREILLEVATALGWDIDKFSYADFLNEVHELFEAVKKSDAPIINPRDMPRSRADRIAWMTNQWVPPSREAELERLAHECEEGLPAVQKWIEENVPPQDQEVWLAAVEDSQLIRTDVAAVFLEVHAFQPARKALMVHIGLLNENKEERFPLDAVEPHIRRAEKIITLPVLKAKLRELRRVMRRLKRKASQT